MCARLTAMARNMHRPSPRTRTTPKYSTFARLTFSLTFPFVALARSKTGRMDGWGGSVNEPAMRAKPDHRTGRRETRAPVSANPAATAGRADAASRAWDASAADDEDITHSSARVNSAKDLDGGDPNCSIQKVHAKKVMLANAPCPSITGGRMTAGRPRTRTAPHARATPGSP